MCRSESRTGGIGPPGRTHAGDRGYVTAETAMIIPLLVTLTGLLIWGVMAAVAQVRCVDAARAGAREAARSEPSSEVLQAAREAAPAGAEVSVRRDGDMVRVRITVPAPRFPVTLTAEAAALAEDSVGGGDGP
ncbi:TadE family type IV pilus minor pilin [Actinacidiphila rubida]|uniref:TadE-like protein n=1 Tax=Actinacidiphila rubida TaxID=310780 RepID=A0A1H8PKJ1_9ACTN|nr:TadE family type IV pilus minor pilin [Actinacidiphila rubida]SEO42470.1 TadE-like protein [Actinacidiphila rubida]